ncbi:sn-glycerol-3-phosphate ABC transporter substrate-binding protein UgpB [Bartonella henselae]|uniref:sn-glycerol-3-phosphate ABC transporter substrate-binding protein UgpB n=1 Tax=Bartonella henselae TaxID=38323 RepID=UPI0004378A7E|nr:sn-glycerol-3-phosphate ABC transporter substrate-binding protein UgpB [Bartonella henselae]OLL40866.1 glycerol-3-phosphate ABC transporter substrate-binding protein [Bartonella henselae]OLL42077.1 glycerol-3-phosphate ABC transporter substrate-binding protein [Bartonella henselae]OLL43137.1 glycerol-3-phosphate ABC transporter substrate-binding protein [Bartonella henselae]OLL43664.1 glycerol-3-phosphate ABC transporter substrate-binding protein [Bartonella henselae]CDO39594.1 sn-glycerol-
MSRFYLSIAAFTVAISVTTAGFAQTKISFWHSMSGELGKQTENLINDFNASQSEYKVIPSFRGEYEEGMISLISAFRGKQQPVLVQIYEIGTGTMMAAKGAIYPIYQLMKDTKQEFDPTDYLPAISGYYSDVQGRMLSMPFNASTPILYYNKDIFKKAGLDPEQPPKTWQDVENFSKKILETKAASCGFTMAYASQWIGIENFSALHNIPFGTKENGFSGLNSELTFNGPLQVRMWTDLKKWSDQGIFRYGGPAGALDATPMFMTQNCAIFMQSSGSRAGILSEAVFNVGFGMLPYYDNVEGAPQNSIIGGASIWALKGHTPEEYAGAAAFLKFLSKANNQAKWHQITGYLPTTKAAYELSKKQDYYKKNVGADIAIRQITLNPPTVNSKGIRFGNLPQIRSILDQELEAVLNGSKTPKDGLDEAVERGNKLLREFEKANH